MTSGPHEHAERWKTRLYAALKHEKSCTCGGCSGGLNCVDHLYDALLAALAELDQAREALRNLARWADGEVGDDFGTTEWAAVRAALAGSAASGDEAK